MNRNDVSGTRRRARILALRAGSAAALFVMSLGNPVALAQDDDGEAVRYVGGRIQLGLHAESRFNSEVLELLATGTRLTLLERANGLARVRTGAGAEGWVDAAFLSTDSPTNGAPPTAPAGGVDSAELQTLQAQVDALRGERDALTARLERAEQATIEEPSAAPPPQPAPIAPPLPTGTLAELESLAAENARLKRNVEQLERRTTSTPGTASAALVLDPQSAPAPWTVIREWGLWTYVLLGSALLLSFGCGAGLVQWDVRRRHGGFRV